MAYNFKDFDTQFPDDVNEFAFRYNRRFEGCDVLGEMFSRTSQPDLTPATTAGEIST